MHRMLLDVTAIIMLLIVAAVGFVPGLLPAFSAAWAKDPYSIISKLAQTFTVFWVGIGCLMILARLCAPALEEMEARVRAKLTAKRAGSEGAAQ